MQPFAIITAATCYSHWSHIVRSRVYETVRRLFVCLFVHTIIFMPLRRVCCWAPCMQEILIDSGGRWVPSSSSAIAAGSSKCEQCHICGWRRKLNTDWLLLCSVVRYRCVRHTRDGGRAEWRKASHGRLQRLWHHHALSSHLIMRTTMCRPTNRLLPRQPLPRLPALHHQQQRWRHHRLMSEPQQRLAGLKYVSSVSVHFLLCCQWLVSCVYLVANQQNCFFNRYCKTDNCLCEMFCWFGSCVLSLHFHFFWIYLFAAMYEDETKLYVYWRLFSLFKLIFRAFWQTF